MSTSETQAQADKLTRILTHVAETVAWQGGTGTEFKCDAIISAQLLADLCALACEASDEEVESFLAGESFMELQP